MKGRTGIIDYGMGNLRSVYKAVEMLGGNPEIISDGEKIRDFERIILPGVGGFREAVKNLKERNLWEAILEFIRAGKNFLGICLGLQLLFEKGYEFGESEGFGILKGEVIRFPETSGKIPHMGWNQVFLKKDSRVLEGIHDGDFFYFLHSYFPAPRDEEDVLLSSEYGVEFACGFQRENVIGVQFHPEKSGKKGLKFLENFLKL